MLFFLLFFFFSDKIVQYFLRTKVCLVICLLAPCLLSGVGSVWAPFSNPTSSLDTYFKGLLPSSSSWLFHSWLMQTTRNHYSVAAGLRAGEGQREPVGEPEREAQGEPERASEGVRVGKRERESQRGPMRARERSRKSPR